MLLGQVLQNLGDRTVLAETLVAMDDLPLMVEIETVGDQFGEAMSDYAVGAVRRFAAFASDDEWLALMNGVERARDPGTACLRHMLAWSLQRDRDDRHETCGGKAGACKGSCS